MHPVGKAGLEPATSGVSDRRSDQLSYMPWELGPDLNRQHPGNEPGALSIELPSTRRIPDLNR